MMLPIAPDLAKWNDSETIRRVAEGTEEPPSVRRNEDPEDPRNTGEGTLFEINPTPLFKGEKQ